jgi:hypothetical protein
MGADRGAGLADAGPPRLPGRLGREIAQQGCQPNTARPGLRLQLVAHIVIQADGDRNAHGTLRSLPNHYENVVHSGLTDKAAGLDMGRPADVVTASKRENRDLGEVFEHGVPDTSPNGKPDGNGASAPAAALAEARAEAAAACAQRDIARLAARRAAAAAEGHWRGTVAEAERQAAEWQRRAEAAAQQATEWQRRADAAEQQAAEWQRQAAGWQQRYDGLHGRLEAVLRRFGILRAARLIPESGRRFVRQTLLGWGRR